MLTLFLPIDVYQYKFKIDDQWKCNSNFPTCSDKNGNINNIIDLTKKKKEEVTTDFTSSNITLDGGEQKLDETKFINLSKIFKNENNKDEDDDNDKELSNIYYEMNKITNNSSIYNYNNGFNILNKLDRISNEKELGENNKLLQDDLNRLKDNCSYKKNISLRHEHLEHLILNKKNLTHNLKNNNKLISSCSFRYGYKTTTIIYYAKNKKGI